MDKAGFESRAVFRGSLVLQGMTLLALAVTMSNGGDFTRSQALLPIAPDWTSQMDAYGAITTGILA